MRRLINEYGEEVKLQDDQVPEKSQETVYGECVVMHDDLKLKPMWEAVVTKQKWNADGEDQVVDVKTYDHEPTENELIYLLAKNRVTQWGYVTITKGYEFEWV